MKSEFWEEKLRESSISNEYKILRNNRPEFSFQ